MSRLSITLLILLSPLIGFCQEHIYTGQERHRKVTITPYLPDTEATMAVIICPGGSYFWLDKDTEGTLVAQYLQAHGIAAFVLHYRTAGVFAFVTHYRYLFRGRRYPDAQQDLQQAITFLYAHADDYHIDKQRIGVIGFSAGGHLVLSSMTFAPELRPAFIAAIYPVVTMSEPSTHKRSRRALLGDNHRKNRLLQDSLSLERHVTNDCPPVFLVNCLDDPVVDYRNSVLLDSALTAHHIPHTYLQYPSGGHGFGAADSKGTPECRQWKQQFIQWIQQLQL